ncbi:MAG TPA: YrhK family protein [Mycobacterium sp.]|nr:YrhK family protein [Mycobacterium sp.]
MNPHELERKVAARLSARRVKSLLDRYQWFHQTIGVVGGFTFFVGSIFFLYDENWKRAGTWLFVIGSAGMLIGNIGGVIVRYHVDKSRHRESLADRTPTEPIG